MKPLDPNPAIDGRTALRKELDDLEPAARKRVSPDAAARFLAIAGRFDALAQPVRRTLLGSPLAWSDGERAEAAWLHRSCDDLAALGYRLAVEAADRADVSGDHAHALAASTLFHMGETVKWDLAVVPGAPHDMRKLHGLMRLAMERGRHRLPTRMRVEGREIDCTLESLYFRVLLLARFTAGELNGKQIEILDAWMWQWMPVLSGVEEPPPGTALRADLDSSSGLQLGPRPSPGPSLYLPQRPIEAAYHAVVARFHQGEIPAEGIASEFRIEEHVRVLDLVRANLRRSKRDPVERAERHRVDRPVELYIGLAEIMGAGFAPSAPEAAPVTLAAVDGDALRRPRLERERDWGFDEVYDTERRVARLVDESDTGFGLEGTRAQLAAVAAGDLVGIRVSPGASIVLGKVVRSVAARSPGLTLLGVRKLAGAVQRLPLECERSEQSAEPLELLFVAGPDSSGRQDALLVSARDFADRAAAELVAETSDRTYRLRLNRARERGRGWILAGFEVVSSRRRYEFEIA